MGDEIDEEILEELYTWIDEIELSRPKKDVRRDFSDGVLAAEIIKHYCPQLVELHNYPGATSSKNKIINWQLMNRKVFRKLGFELENDVINNIVDCRPYAVEKMLMLLRRKVDRHLYEKKRAQMGGQMPAVGEPMPNDRPESDQQPQQYQQQQQQQQPQAQPPTLTIKVPADPQSTRGRPIAGKSSGVLHPLNMPVPKNYKGDLVPKIVVEEKEQELLSKDETIQILQAKIRRLEHLLHLKDIRVDDLTTKLNTLEHQMRPTMQMKTQGGSPKKQR